MRYMNMNHTSPPCAMLVQRDGCGELHLSCTGYNLWQLSQESAASALVGNLCAVAFVSLLP